MALPPSIVLIRPSALPARGALSSTEEIVVDNGASVAKATVSDIALVGRPTATQGQAEAGTEPINAMTPLTTKQAIDAQVPTIVGGAIAGLNLGSAAQADASDFATAAQGLLADTAVQPGDLGTMAYESASDYAIAARGLPAGGAADQVLVKVSGTDYDTEWRTNTAATAVSYAPQTLTPEQQAQARENIGLTSFSTVSLLLSDTSLSYIGSHPVAPGDIVTAQGFRYEVAASDAADSHVETAGGVRLYVLRTDAGEWNILAFGATTSAPDNFETIQKVIDLRGTVIIPDDPAGGDDYPISDCLLVRSNTTVRWTGNTFIRLTQPSTIGAVIVGYHEGPVGDNQGISDNILFDNPLVDANELGYVVGATYGENGIGGAFVENLHVKGGVIKGCRRGSHAPIGTGGKGVQIENTVYNCTVEGTVVMNSTIGFETTGREGGPTRNLRYSNLVAINCERVISLLQPGSPTSTIVDYNSIHIDGVTAYNCGREGVAGTEQDYGAIVVDRAANAVIDNYVQWNDANYGELGAVIKLYCGYNNKFDVTFNGSAAILVDNRNVAPMFGVVGTRVLNKFVLHHRTGTAGYAVRNSTLAGTVGNTYDIRTSTVATALFDSNAAQEGNYGKFTNLLGSLIIEGRFDRIWAVTSGGYGTTENNHQGDLRINSVIFPYAGNSPISFATLPVYADNAAAVAGGLGLGSIYKTSTGEVRVRV